MTKNAGAGLYLPAVLLVAFISGCTSTGYFFEPESNAIDVEYAGGPADVLDVKDIYLEHDGGNISLTVVVQNMDSQDRVMSPVVSLGGERETYGNACYPEDPDCRDLLPNEKRLIKFSAGNAKNFEIKINYSYTSATRYEVPVIRSGSSAGLHAKEKISSGPVKINVASGAYALSGGTFAVDFSLQNNGKGAGRIATEKFIINFPDELVGANAPESFVLLDPLGGSGNWVFANKDRLSADKSSDAFTFIIKVHEIPSPKSGLLIEAFAEYNYEATYIYPTDSIRRIYNSA
ncbi:MAG: hypothetical protein HY513_02345 [Candidatus Aenigmarchaeota archaeon]|nr:hypothetical protein [Candidatus Aenigmarchaeota archaeon]